MADNFYKKLGLKIRTIRERLDLKQEKLAHSMGISRVALSQIENGERKISAEEIAKLAKIFNLSSDLLMDLEKDIEMIVEKTKESPRDKQEIRISVPQKNP